MMIFFLKPLSFLPALLMMSVIFGFSAQTGEVSGSLSYDVSYKVVEIGNKALNQDLEEWQIKEYASKIEHPLRKLAHMTEYFFLAVTVSFPLYVYGLRGVPLMLLTGLICVGFAAGDEYHQSFVAERSPSARDVVIDSVGVFLGILAVRFVLFLCNFLSSGYFSDKKNTTKGCC